VTRGSRVAAVALPLLAAPLAAEAQPASRIPRIAFLSTTSPGTSPTTDAFLQGLRELGYVEGQNITVEWRWGRGTTEHFPEFASDVVGLGVDLIVAANNPAGYAAQRVTHTIPIVISTMIDPVAVGFVASLARPGGNITGLTADVTVDTWGKCLELVKEVAPAASRIAVPIYKNGIQIGKATSTTWSPTLKKLIALATLKRAYSKPGTILEIEITVEAVRYRVAASVVKTPFFNPIRKTATPVL